MKKALLAGALLGAFGGVASAADIPVKAPYRPPPPPVWSWTGFYVGANGGYSFGRDDFTQSLAIVPGTVRTSTSPNKIAPTGGFGGLQIGYNWQFGAVVLGAEADYQWADQTDTTCGGLCGNLVMPGVVFVGVGDATSVYQKVKSFSTVRARLGWANDGAMIYVTGGGAWMKVDSTESISFGVIPGFATVTSAASFSNTKSGYSIGAGIEMRLFANLTAKIEYLHLDVSGVTHSFFPGPGTLFVGPGGSLTTTTGRIKDEIVRVGLNWKFGGYGGPGYGGPGYAAY
jgi:outer membrane immunogenic protein